MVLIIRPATATDAAGAAEVLNPIIAKGGTTALEHPLSMQEIEEWFLFGPKVWCCHIAEQDGQVIGFQSVGRYGDLPEGWGEMGTYVRLGQVQAGAGTALFAATKQATRALGLTHLNAKIRCDNSGGLAYYSRMGFAADRAAPSATLADGRVIARVSKQFDL